jgi:hypothetical protein
MFLSFACTGCEQGESARTPRRCRIRIGLARDKASRGRPAAGHRDTTRNQPGHRLALKDRLTRTWTTMVGNK